MKYLEYSPLERINNFLSHLNLGQCTIESRLEAYSCKNTGTDKKMSFSLENKILDYLGKSSETDSPSPADYFLCRSSRRTLVYLLLTLNHMYPDYDFSSRLMSLVIDIRHSDLTLEWSDEQQGSFIETLQKALDDVIKLSECEVFSYTPAADAEPLENGSIWSFNFFFYNKRRKRVVGFRCSSVSNLLTDGFAKGELESNSNGEIFDTMDM